MSDAVNVALVTVVSASASAAAASVLYSRPRMRCAAADTASNMLNLAWDEVDQMGGSVGNVVLL